MAPTKKKAAEEGKKKGYVSQETWFNRAFQYRLGKWVIKHKSRKPGDPKVPIAKGPEHAHFMGMLLPYDSPSEKALGKTGLGGDWKLWKETYPTLPKSYFGLCNTFEPRTGNRFGLPIMSKIERARFTW